MRTVSLAAGSWLVTTTAQDAGVMFGLKPDEIFSLLHYFKERVEVDGSSAAKARTTMCI